MEAALKLVVIEDEPDINFIIEATLARDPDILVTFFATASEALHSMSIEDCDFDLALVDLNLPDMSGLQLIKSIRSMPQCGDAKFALFTASLVRDPDLNEAGVVGLIEKPFKTSSLRKRVLELAGYH